MVLGSMRGKAGYSLLFFLVATLIGRTTASLGDHLPDFKECVKVLHTTTMPVDNAALTIHPDLPNGKL